MEQIVSIGRPPWTRQEILEQLEQFMLLYADRPIKDNQDGMKAPHMFAVWFMVKKLSPDLIVESGVWKGQSTWLLEQACPNARLVSIDLNLNHRLYISDSAVYSDMDFSEQDWINVTENSLVFFDDHQNAYRRLQQCKWFGFKHIIFEDNYPISQGDSYSLKKAFANAGFDPGITQKQGAMNNLLPNKLKRFIQRCSVNSISVTPQYDTVNIRPNQIDSRMLYKHLEIYYEFPPVVKTSKTRWGDDWNDVLYPTPEPILSKPSRPKYEIFIDEAMFYTWICYAKLK